MTRDHMADQLITWPWTNQNKSETGRGSWLTSSLNRGPIKIAVNFIKSSLKVKRVIFKMNHVKTSRQENCRIFEGQTNKISTSLTLRNIRVVSFDVFLGLPIYLSDLYNRIMLRIFKKKHIPALICRSFWCAPPFYLVNRVCLKLSAYQCSNR